MWIRQSTDLISKVLSPAIKFWLRSQVEQVEQLKFKIQGQDNQILRGYIPSVYLESSKAIYQGLHLGDIQLQGNNIRINIGQVVRGKPLKLLESIWVKGEVFLTQEDLQASLASDLLKSGLNDLCKLLQKNLNLSEESTQYQIKWQSIRLDNNQFNIIGQLITENESFPLEIESELRLIDGKTLGLKPHKLKGISTIDKEEFDLSELSIDLGSDVEINHFELTSEGIFAQGQLVIRP
jgi:hypothetical protein